VPASSSTSASAGLHRLAVVGAGVAGVSAARTLRRHGYDGELTVVDPRVTDVAVAGSDVRRIHCAAAGLDLERRVLHLQDGREIAFDGLIIATGARPPQLWTATLSFLTGGCSPERIVGAGFAHPDVHRLPADSRTAVIDMAPVATAGAVPVTGHRRLGPGRASLEPAPAVLAEVIALGASRSTEWTAGSGLRLGSFGGVLCDPWCRVLGPDGAATDRVVAVGDVAMWHQDPNGPGLQVEHWTDPAGMAVTAAVNVLSGAMGGEPHRCAPLVWSDACGRRFSYGPRGGPALRWEEGGTVSTVSSGDLACAITVGGRTHLVYAADVVATAAGASSSLAG
jgi:NADH dehydrogenase, FAD-containing subunit